MKSILPLMMTALILTACSAATDIAPAQKGFNADLAEELGADPYGMHSYIFVAIKTGPNDAEITDEAERAELFAGHFATIEKLAEAGKLVLAGPFVESPPLRGLFILDVKTIEEAKELVKEDPTIKAGIFELEFSKYYGSAALKKVNEIHETIQEKDM